MMYRQDRFDLKDGLPGLAEERWPEPSLVESSSGVLLFSTTKGIVWIDPSKLGGTRNRIPPPVFVNNVVDKGKIYSGTSGPLALPAKGNLEFNYTALSLAIPERVFFVTNSKALTPTGRAPARDDRLSIRTFLRASTGFT
jgi:hypothetical protein